MKRQTVTEYLENFYQNGDDTAYVHHRGYRTIRWSYRQVAETTFQTARELETRRVGRGDCVMIWGENCAEWIVAFFGCLLRGAIAVPMDRITPADFALRVCRHVDAKLLICSRAQPILDRALPILVMEDLLQTVSCHSRRPYPLPDLEPAETVEIVFTSGTTAAPKGVVISHRNVLANLEPLEAEIVKYRKYARIFHPIRFLNLLPLSHVFGQFLGIFIPQLLAGTVIFQETLNPSEIIRSIKHEHVSIVVTVPRLLETLREKLQRDLEAASRWNWFRLQFERAESEPFLKRCWRFRELRRRFGWKFWAFICGGAALDFEIERFWSRLGFVVIQGYGLTETTALISVNHPFRLGKGSIGKVLPGREVKLAQNGEILVRGESVAAGYWQDQEVKPVLEEEGWFHTGDLGELGKNGNLYFKGRKKDVIVTREGMNIYPEDLEAAVRRQPEVQKCIVIPLPRDGNAEPCAVLILRDPAQDPEPIIRRANQSLASYQQIRHWFIWPEEDFPRTPTLKVRAGAIQETVEAKLGGRGKVSVTGDTLADLIARIKGRPIPELSPDASLERDLNLSSIDRVELLSALEDRYQVDVSEAKFSAAITVGELEQMLRQRALDAGITYDYPCWPQRWPITWIRLAVYYLLVWPTTQLLARPQIRGRENLRAVRKPLLVVSNHITAIDIGFILAALPRRVRHRLATAMEGEILRGMQHPPVEFGFFRKCIQKLAYVLVVALFNVFPLPQQSGFRRSFAFAGESVDRDYSILIFPEGMRTQDGQMAPFQTGIGLLANNLHIPVVPMRIDGLFELKKAGKRVARPGGIKVSIGQPIQFGAGVNPDQIARMLQEQVENLRMKK
ncbi:MAG: AMP-binding protein [Acidobacteria bacterium]|nr:AMP-binding protein [Acidobacteriota bacterium]